MIRYKCIKSFSIPEVDLDGFDEGRLHEVEVGSVYERDDELNILGADVHLEGEHDWIEISYKDLKEYFEELKGGAK